MTLHFEGWLFAGECYLQSVVQPVVEQIEWLTNMFVETQNLK